MGSNNLRHLIIGYKNGLFRGLDHAPFDQFPALASLEVIGIGRTLQPLAKCAHKLKQLALQFSPSLSDVSLLSTAFPCLKSLYLDTPNQVTMIDLSNCPLLTFLVLESSFQRVTLIVPPSLLKVGLTRMNCDVSVLSTCSNLHTLTFDELGPDADGFDQLAKLTSLTSVTLKWFDGDCGWLPREKITSLQLCDPTILLSPEAGEFVSLTTLETKNYDPPVGLTMAPSLCSKLDGAPTLETLSDARAPSTLTSLVLRDCPKLRRIEQSPTSNPDGGEMPSSEGRRACSCSLSRFANSSRRRH